MNKSLSETHPTLWSLLTERDKLIRAGISVNKIQSCTVDVAKHKRVVDSLIEITEDNARLIDRSQEYEFEVERLKKELEQERKWRIQDQEGYDNGWKDGLVEGEHRAMNKVKEAVLHVANDLLGGEISDCDELSLLCKELGLGEEEKNDI